MDEALARRAEEADRVKISDVHRQTKTVHGQAGFSGDTASNKRAHGKYTSKPTREHKRRSDGYRECDRAKELQQKVGNSVLAASQCLILCGSDEKHGSGSYLCVTT